MKLRFYFFFLLIFLSVAYADMLVTKEGDKIYCDILNETDSSVFYEGEFGEIEIPKDSVKEIVIEAEKMQKRIRIGFFRGEVRLYDNDGDEEKFEYGSRIRVGDSIVTGSDGRVEIFMYKNDILVIEENSSVSIRDFVLNKRDKLFARSFYLEEGRIVCLIRKDYREMKPVEIATPGAVVSASSSILSIVFDKDKRSTSVDLIEKDGDVGLRPTRMDIGEVLLRNDAHAVLDEIEGKITEIEISEDMKNSLKVLNENLQNKHIKMIKYPRRPLNKKKLIIGGGILATAGILAAILLSKEDSSLVEEESTTTTVKLKW